MIIQKYPISTRAVVSELIERKNRELTNLDWAKWAGWFDTDGTFAIKKRGGTPMVRIALKDMEPVKLFSETFENSFAFNQFKTKSPQGKIYDAKVYVCEVNSIGKCKWLAENMFPYLIGEEKKNYAAKVIGYMPESKPFDEWTKEEALAYFATAIDGDGGIQLKNGTTVCVSLFSSNAEYLAQVKELMESKFNVHFSMQQSATYETKAGTRHRFNIYLGANKENFDLYKLLVANNVMTLERKRKKILYFLKLKKAV